VLEGQGLTSRAFDLLAETMPLDVLSAKLADLKTRIDTNVAAMSAHADFIARYAPGAVEAPRKAAAQ
jgi:tryptophan halogenase